MATFTNQATLSYNNTVTESNVVTGEILESLTMTKTALSETYGSGDTLTYVISIVNTGSSAYTGLTLSDDLGAYEFGTRFLVPLTYEEGTLRLFTGGVLSPTPTVTAGPPLTVSGINLPAGGSVLLVYNVSVNNLAPLGSGATVTNTATLTGNGIVTPVSASETVQTDTAAYLTITKAIDPVAVADNQPITYTFTVQNYGATAVGAEGNAVISDLFDPVLSGLTVILNGTPLAEGSGYTYNEASGLFSTVAGVLTVPGATYSQSIETGEVTVIPGTAILTVSGTV